MELLGRVRGDANQVAEANHLYAKARPAKTMRTALCALALNRAGHPSEDPAGVLEQCTRLRTLALQLGRTSRRMKDDALSYFGFSELAGNDEYLEFAHVDAKAQALATKLVKSESPTSAAHQRVEKKAILWRIGCVAAASASLLAREAARHVDAEQGVDCVENTVILYGLHASMHTCGGLLNECDDAAFMRLSVPYFTLTPILSGVSESIVFVSMRSMRNGR